MATHRLLLNTWVAVMGLGLAACGDDGAPAEGNAPLSPAGGAGSSGDDMDGAPTANGFTEQDCVAPPNAAAAWLGEREFGTRCQVVCNAGRADCDGQRSNGCETDTSDPVACGRCVDSCLTDLCGGSAACTSYQAEVWAFEAPIGGEVVRDLAVNAQGQIFVRMNGVAFDTGAPPLSAVAPGSVVALDQGGTLWQSAPGDSYVDDNLRPSATATRVVATSAGLYVAERFSLAELGERFEATPSDDPASAGSNVMLSLVSYAGERIWSRTLSTYGSPSVFGLFADEASDVYVHVNTDADFVYEGREMKDGYALFAFSSAGDFKWLEALNPLPVRPASGGLFFTQSLFGGDDVRSAETGAGLRRLQTSTLGAQMIAVGADGGMIVSGTVVSSDLQQHQGLPGLSGVTVLDGQMAPNRDAIFVQKWDASGRLVWETHFAPLLVVTVHDLQVSADGTAYVLASGKVGGALASEPERVFVARVGPDGQQQAAFRFDVRSPRALAFALGEDGALHLGAHFNGGAVLDTPISGAGIIGADLRFTPMLP